MAWKTWHIQKDTPPEEQTLKEFVIVPFNYQIDLESGELTWIQRMIRISWRHWCTCIWLTDCCDIWSFSVNIVMTLLILLGSDLAERLEHDASFSMMEGHVSEKTLAAIKDMGFTQLMPIQKQTIPSLLLGRLV